MDTSTQAVRRRANGRLQSCDQCRRQKLACDHSHPCLRCKKRSLESRCRYSVPEVAISKTRKTRQFSSAKVVTPFSISAGSTNTRLDDSSSTGPSHSSPTNRAPYPRGGVGYLGFTSFKPVYDETTDSLSLLGAPPSAQEGGQSNQVDDPLATQPPEFRELCLAVLRQLPCPEKARMLPRDTTSCNDVWVYYSAAHILRGLYETWSDHLAVNRSELKLEEMARAVCINTARDLGDDPTDIKLWFSRFTGTNLRWEAIGILFIYLDIKPSDRYVRETLDSMQKCIQICKEFGGCPTVWLHFLYHKRTVLESLVSGDASLAVWRYHAEAMAVLTFRGMHADPSPPNRPNVASEIKRRLLWTYFSLDKVVVSFTGRPPLLPRKYISTPLPLDLKDDYLFADEDTLAQAVATTLDNRGWNTEGGLYSATSTRARAMIALIRDEIFEFALSSNLATCSTKELLDLRSKALSTYDEFPQCIHYRAEESADVTVKSQSFAFTRLLIKLEYLQCLFFLDRILLKRDHREVEDLLGVSFEMVTLTVSLWTRMDRFSFKTKDFEWILMGFGAPAGGILCMELLTATLQGAYVKHPDISRSSITQTLSLLVGFLDWVDPSAPNGHLCKKTKTTIQQVLDQALNAVSPPLPCPEAYVSDFSTQFDFNFDLMDTFDWLRSEPSSSQ